MDYSTLLLAILEPQILLLILLGVAMGILFGAIPGLNAPIAIALVLPFTYSMDIIPSVALILGIYIGGISGGLVSAILLRIPGAASSATTVLDGYPMTQKGRGADALSIGTFVSFLGGMFSLLFLIFLTPMLSKVALAFGPLEYLGAVVIALSLVCVLMNGNVLRGFLSVFIGLVLASIGISPIDGTQNRFTFGSVQLAAGFDIILIMLGMYALTEVFSVAGRIKADIQVNPCEKRLFYFPRRSTMKGQAPNIARSTLIGTFIGILPGMGPSAAGIVSYSLAKKSSKHPEEFGTGCVSGLVASETANNAVTGGALIPMLSLGVPGDICTSVILSALTMQGITCGPLLVLQHQDLFIQMVIVCIIANIFMLLVQSGTIRFTSKMVQVPPYYLLPVIVVFCCTGVFAIHNRAFDLYALAGFALLGYILEKNNFPIMPLILAYVLGPMLENYYRATIMYYDTLGSVFSEFSAGTVLLLIGVCLVVYGVLNEIPVIHRFFKSLPARLFRKTKTNEGK